MRKSIKFLVVILFCSFSFDSLGQERLPPIANPSRDNFALLSSAPLVPIDSLVPPRSQPTVAKIIICGPCGQHGDKPVYILTIKGKSVPLPMELSDKVPASSIEAINILTRNKARKFGAGAVTNGVVVISVKKEFEKEILAALPSDYKKLHNL
ncbi:hypothetical protein [Daejeonella lutea]|uniref:hypothetical protein n=1 Tax=Daejeonella lutea TaxID=572036 RepID=UPI001116C70A|nr:hypothetical protein [Daejeonella lutea]